MQAPPPQPKTIKCTNCGTENPGSSTVCSNCGSPLPKVTPVQSAAPQVAQPFAGKAKPKKFPWILVGGILAFLAVCCVVIGALFFIPTKSIKATVTDVHWQTSVPVQEIRAVDYTNEAGNPPSDAYNVSCRDESHDVCENKTIDKGNGYSEVVQECRTETQKYCSYTVDEWKTIQTYTLDGNDLQPVYDNPSLSSGQRVGDQTEDLTVTFSTQDGEQKNYSPNSTTEFQQYQVGTTWTLKMNTLGGVTGVQP